jgi:hypothetical protein
VRGFQFSGALAPEFDRLMSTLGLTWSVQDGAIQILGADEVTQEKALQLGPSSGLLGSPKRIDKGLVSFQCMMIADIAVGRKVVLESDSIKGAHKLT